MSSSNLLEILPKTIEALTQLTNGEITNLVPLADRQTCLYYDHSANDHRRLIITHAMTVDHEAKRYIIACVTLHEVARTTNAIIVYEYVNQCAQDDILSDMFRRNISLDVKLIVGNDGSIAFPRDRPTLREMAKSAITALTKNYFHYEQDLQKNTIRPFPTSAYKSADAATIVSDETIDRLAFQLADYIMSNLPDITAHLR